MIEELTKDSTKRFYVKDKKYLLVSVDTCGYINFTDERTKGIFRPSVKDLWVEAKREPVNFIDAIKSGKRISVKSKYLSSNDFKNFRILMTDLLSIYTTKNLIDIILNGEWFIE